MARKNEAGQLLRTGLDPAAIANRMGVTFSTVAQYLRTLVGEGVLRQSDLYFSIPKEKRQLLQAALGESTRRRADVPHRTSEYHASREELAFFASLRSRRVFAGDMYEYISDTEVALHELVRHTLMKGLGPEESGWWRKGIGEAVRTECQRRREQDEEPSESPYAYTTLIDLSKIAAANWQLFQGVLPAQYASDRKQLEADLRRLNGLRNAVMHPVKGRKWSEDDFLFVRQVQRAIVGAAETCRGRSQPSTTVEGPATNRTERPKA